MKKILIYGDSNVWGDNFITGIRIPFEKQWPNILEKKLNNQYKILQEGLPGRLAGDEEKEKPYKNGKDVFLSTFRTQAPVNSIVLMLGTNDLQIKYNKDTNKIIEDLNWYTKTIESEFSDLENRKKYFMGGVMPNIIYILPSNFEYSENKNNIFDEKSEEKRKQIIDYYTNQNKYKYIHIKNVPLLRDGVHFSYEGHKMVANIIKNNLFDND